MTDLGARMNANTAINLIIAVVFINVYCQVMKAYEVQSWWAVLPVVAAVFFPLAPIRWTDR